MAKPALGALLHDISFPNYSVHTSINSTTENKWLIYILDNLRPSYLLALTEGRLNPGYQTNYKLPNCLLCFVLHIGIFSTPVGVV